MGPRRTIGLIVCLAVLLGCGQGAAERAYTFTRFAMDTAVEYTIVADSRTQARDAMLAAHEEIERVAAMLWEEDPGSEIFRLNQSDGPIAVDPEVYSFLVRTIDYSRATNGAFDVTVLPLLELYDFTGDGVVPERAALEHALGAIGYGQLQFDADFVVDRGPALIAVGGVAKGYAVDRAIRKLRGLGVEHALVNAGGDLYAMGLREGRPWRVGIRHPDDPTELVDVLEISDAAVATSGDYQRYFFREGKRYHHLLDPTTGQPARLVRSATVVAPTSEMADALSTGLFVAGAAGLATLPSGTTGFLIEGTGAILRSHEEAVATLSASGR